MRSAVRHVCGEDVDGAEIEAFVILVEGGTTFLHIHAGMHGDEPEGRDVAQRLLQDIRAGILIPGSSLVIIPAINPSGLSAGTRGNGRGVDLNRNFPTSTWTDESRDPRYYPGSEPASEPETRAVIKALDLFEAHAIVTLHTWIRQVNYDGDDAAAAIAAFLAERNGYKVTPYIGYPTPGSFGTFGWLNLNVPTITLEMPENSGVEVCESENGAALRELIEWGGVDPRI